MCCSSDGGTARQQKQQQQQHDRRPRKDHQGTDTDGFRSGIDAATTTTISDTIRTTRLNRFESTDRSIGLPFVAIVESSPFPVRPSPPALPLSPKALWIVSVVLLLVSVNGAACLTTTTDSAVPNGSTAISISIEHRTLSKVVDDGSSSAVVTLTIPEVESQTISGQSLSQIAPPLGDAVVVREHQRHTPHGESADLRQTTTASQRKYNSATKTAVAAAASYRKPTALAKREFVKYLLSNVGGGAATIDSRQSVASINISSIPTDVPSDLTNAPPPVDGDTRTKGLNDHLLASTVDFDTRLPPSTTSTSTSTSTSNAVGEEHESPSTSNYQDAQTVSDSRNVPDEPVTNAGSEPSNTSSIHDDSSHETQDVAGESVVEILSTSGVEASTRSSDDQFLGKDVSFPTTVQSPTDQYWTTMSVPPSQSGFTEVASRSDIGEASLNPVLRGTATASVPSAQKLFNEASRPSSSTDGGGNEITVSGGTRRCLQTRDSRRRSTTTVDCVSGMDGRNAIGFKTILDQPKFSAETAGDENDPCRTFTELFCDSKLLNRFLKSTRRATTTEPEVDRSRRRQLSPSSRPWCENPNDVELMKLIDQRATKYYGLFEESMMSYDCVDSYSSTSSCSACQDAYRDWLCVNVIAFADTRHQGGTVRLLCPSYCDEVARLCPYLSPHHNFAYAGEPVFSCTGFHATHYFDHDPESVRCDEHGIFMLDLDPDNDFNETTETSESCLNSTTNTTDREQHPVPCRHSSTTNDADASDHQVPCGDTAHDVVDDGEDDVIDGATTTEYYFYSASNDESVATSGQRSLKLTIGSCMTPPVVMAMIVILVTAR